MGHQWLEWTVIIAMVVLLVRMASAEGYSPVLWGSVTFVLCVIACLTIEMLFLRVILAGVVAFVAMTVCNLMRKERKPEIMRKRPKKK